MQALAEVLLRALFPREMSLDVWDSSVLHHIRQIERRRTPAVDSEVIGKAHKMTLCATEGQYIGLGDQVFKTSPTRFPIWQEFLKTGKVPRV